MGERVRTVPASCAVTALKRERSVRVVTKDVKFELVAGRIRPGV